MEAGAALVEKAIDLNPNYAMAFRFGAVRMGISVRPKRRLSTRNGLTGSTHWTPVGAGILGYVIAYFGIGRS